MLSSCFRISKMPFKKWNVHVNFKKFTVHLRSCFPDETKWYNMWAIKKGNAINLPFLMATMSEVLGLTGSQRPRSSEVHDSLIRSELKFKSWENPCSTFNSTPSTYGVISKLLYPDSDEKRFHCEREKNMKKTSGLTMLHLNGYVYVKVSSGKLTQI